MKKRTDVPKMTLRQGNKNVEREMPKLRGLISDRAYFLLSRFYLWGYIQKPLDQVTDEEFMAIPGMGLITLKEIRRVLPGPTKEVIAAK
jgi:hypothetical protein